MVPGHYGNRNRVDSAAQLTLQWDMALLDIRHHLRRECCPLLHFLGYFNCSLRHLS